MNMGSLFHNISNQNKNKIKSTKVKEEVTEEMLEWWTDINTMNVCVYVPPEY